MEDNLKISNEIIDYCSNKKVLICEKSTTFRSAISNIVGELGISTLKVEIVKTNLSDCLEQLNKNQQHIVFFNENFDKHNTFELFKIHEKIITNRLNTLFFVLTENNSYATASSFMDYEIDGLISAPINVNNIKMVLNDSILKKINPSEKRSIYEKAKTFFLEESYQKVIDYLEKLLTGVNDFAQGRALMGNAYFKLNNYGEAEAQYNLCLKLNPNEYKGLSALSNLFIVEKRFNEACEINKLILEKYPINFNKIFDQIKISVATKNYFDIIKLSEIFKEKGIQTLENKKFVAAALVMAGKYLIENEDPKGVKVLTDAVTISTGSTEILKNATLAIAKLGHTKEAIDLLEKYSGSQMPHDLFIMIQFKIMFYAKNYSKLLMLSDEMVQSTLIDLEAFEMLILSSIEAGLSEKRIEYFFNLAITKYPEEKEVLQSLAFSAQDNEAGE